MAEGDIFNLSRLQSTYVELTLIDAHTGEVLGLFQITGGPSVDKGVAKSVAKLPRE